MKKLVLFFALIVAGQLVSAQGLKYGIKAGVNFANQEFKEEGVTLTPSAITSFHIQGLVDYGISSSFSIQPGIGVSGKGFKIESDGVNWKTDLMYVEIPVNAVAKFPFSSVGKFFVGAGPYAAFGISGKSKIEMMGEEESTDKVFDKEEGMYKKSDFGVNILGGLELTKGFTINANYGLGLSNIALEDGGTAKNKVFSVSVGFLF
ncbi:MAG: hypothetical protein JWQ25_2469 [Daejeonella sp.]|nr:hypothetical protein [Daejeonella sp.]